MPIRYLLDENVDPMYKAQLLRRQPDLVVWAVGDPGAPQVGSLDPDIPCWCEDHGFILITSNRKSMPGQLADLQTGAYVFVVATRDAGRALTAALVLAGKDGLVSRI